MVFPRRRASSENSCCSSARVTGSSAPKGSSINRMLGSRQRSCHTDALALSAGKLRRAALRKFSRLESHQPQKLRSSRRECEMLPVFESRNQADILLHRKMRKQSGVLNNVANMPPQANCIPLRRGFAFHQNLPAGRHEHTVDQSQ